MPSLPFPVHIVTDNSGAIVTGATVTISAVEDKEGNAIASHGATVSLCGANVCVNYDAEAKGDAWVTLNISKQGSDFAGLLAAPRAFLVRDCQRIAAGIDASGQTRLGPSGMDAVQIEPGVNARQALSPILAAAAGQSTGAGTPTVAYKAAGAGNEGTTRITATLGSNNRTAVALNLPS